MKLKNFFIFFVFACMLMLNSCTVYINSPTEFIYRNDCYNMLYIMACAAAFGFGCFLQGHFKVTLICLLIFIIG